MPRYFEFFFPADPMTEISEAEARGSGSYAVEANVGAMTRYEVWVQGQLDHAVYPEAEPGPQIAELQRTKDAGVPTWITSTAIRDGDQVRYTIWYYDRGDRLEKRVERVNTPGRDVSTWYDAEGRLGGTLERRFNEHGEQIEVVATTPDGRRLVVDD